MDSPHRSYRLHLFTLHLWEEAMGQDQVEWRGRVTNTSTGAIAYFRRWEELERLLPALIDDATRYSKIDDDLLDGNVLGDDLRAPD